MATPSQLFRRILPRNLSRPFSSRAYSAEAAVQSIPPQAPPAQAIRKSPDRVKWDYRGQKKVIPLGQWIPKMAVDAYGRSSGLLRQRLRVEQVVLRGDLNKITVGFCSNVQERCVVHAAWSSPTVVSGDEWRLKL